jgi:periplasmic divalent cation tolerance protein
MSEPDPSETILVLVTYPEDGTPPADAFAERLVDRQRAACVNVLPDMDSYFHWDGDLEHAEEVLLIAKTSRDTYPELEEMVIQEHPYDEPEVIGISLSEGSSAYLEWVQDALA